MAQQGGRRRGQPGKAYPERTDLMAQPIKTAPNQPYGQAGAQAQAMRSIPLPQTASSPPPVIGPEAPTQRPNEHVMAGVPVGPGAGPEAIQPPPVNMANSQGNADVLSQLQALLQVHPNPGLIDLVAGIKAGNYQRGGLYGKPIGQP
jgi:hypothetical protein